MFKLKGRSIGNSRDYGLQQVASANGSVSYRCGGSEMRPNSNTQQKSPMVAATQWSGMGCQKTKHNSHN